MDNGVTRRAFVIHMGTAAAFLGGAHPAPAQTAPAPVAGKEKLIVRSPRPINLETPFGQLAAEITPTDLFFVRNNYDGPEIDASQYVLKVDGDVDNPLTLRLDDLKRMEQITQTITLECAGNGRSFHSPKSARSPVGERRRGHRGVERGPAGRHPAPGPAPPHCLACRARRE